MTHIEIRETTNTVSGLGEYRGWFVILNGVLMHFHPFQTKAAAEAFAASL